MGLGTIPHIKRPKGGEEHLQVKKEARVVQLIEWTLVGTYRKMKGVSRGRWVLWQHMEVSMWPPPANQAALPADLKALSPYCPTPTPQPPYKKLPTAVPPPHPIPLPHVAPGPLVHVSSYPLGHVAAPPSHLTCDSRLVYIVLMYPYMSCTCHQVICRKGKKKKKWGGRTWGHQWFEGDAEKLRNNDNGDDVEEKWGVWVNDPWVKYKMPLILVDRFKWEFVKLSFLKW